VNTLPINVHIQYFDQLYEILLKSGKKIDFINLSGGFAIFDHLLKQKANPVVRIVSSHTLPFASRVSEDQIKILNRRSNTPVSISQETLIPVVKYFEELMGTPLPINNNPLFTSIDRSSYVLHPLITMMNFTKIEKNQKFYFYRDGLTKSVEKMLIEAGHERMALCQELGFNDFISPENRVKNFIDTYMDDFANVLPPASANHRFFTEDIPYGLVFQCSLGRYLNIKMPLSESLITFSSSICNQDFWQSPFNLLHRSDLLDIVLSYKKMEKI
jgi:opine dehydrogenase